MHYDMKDFSMSFHNEYLKDVMDPLCSCKKGLSIGTSVGCYVGTLSVLKDFISLASLTKRSFSHKTSGFGLAVDPLVIRHLVALVYMYSMQLQITHEKFRRQ